jgi:hypothetical protein
MKDEYWTDRWIKDGIVFPLPRLHYVVTSLNATLKNIELLHNRFTVCVWFFEVTWHRSSCCFHYQTLQVSSDATWDELGRKEFCWHHVKTWEPMSMFWMSRREVQLAMLKKLLVLQRHGDSNSLLPLPIKLSVAWRFILCLNWVRRDTFCDEWNV